MLRGGQLASFVLFPNCYIRRPLVQSYAKSFKFCFDDRLVAKRFEHVEHDENQVACSRDCARGAFRWRGKPPGAENVPAMTCLPRPRPSAAPSMMPAALQARSEHVEKGAHAGAQEVQPLLRTQVEYLYRCPMYLDCPGNRGECGKVDL